MNLNELAAEVHLANAKWWFDQYGNKLDRNDGEMIALMHSELSEALEGVRKDTMDDHLPHRKAVEVEMVDCIIRILDYMHARGYDVQGAYDEKMAYNRVRADHKLENRMKAGGKRF